MSVVAEVSVVQEVDHDQYSMFRVSSGLSIGAKVTVNGNDLSMEVDTGASVSIVSEDTFLVEFVRENLPLTSRHRHQTADQHWRVYQSPRDCDNECGAQWPRKMLTTGCHERKRTNLTW